MKSNNNYYAALALAIVAASFQKLFSIEGEVFTPSRAQRVEIMNRAPVASEAVQAEQALSRAERVKILQRVPTANLMKIKNNNNRSVALINTESGKIKSINTTATSADIAAVLSKSLAQRDPQNPLTTAEQLSLKQAITKLKSFDSGNQENGAFLKEVSSDDANDVLSNIFAKRGVSLSPQDIKDVIEKAENLHPLTSLKNNFVSAVSSLTTSPSGNNGIINHKNVDTDLQGSAFITKRNPNSRVIGFNQGYKREENSAGKGLVSRLKNESSALPQPIASNTEKTIYTIDNQNKKSTPVSREAKKAAVEKARKLGELKKTLSERKSKLYEAPADVSVNPAPDVQVASPVAKQPIISNKPKKTIKWGENQVRVFDKDLPADTVSDASIEALEEGQKEAQKVGSRKNPLSSISPESERKSELYDAPADVSVNPAQGVQVASPVAEQPVISNKAKKMDALSFYGPSKSLLPGARPRLGKSSANSEVAPADVSVNPAQDVQVASPVAPQLSASNSINQFDTYNRVGIPAHQVRRKKAKQGS